MKHFWGTILFFFLIALPVSGENNALDSVWNLNFGASIEEITGQLQNAGIKVAHRNQDFEKSETVLNVEWRPIFGRTAQVIQIIFQGGRFSKLRVLYPDSGENITLADTNYFDVQGAIDRRYFKGTSIPHLRNASVWAFPGGGKIYLGQIVPSITVAIVER